MQMLLLTKRLIFLPGISSSNSPDVSLCDKSNFSPSKWLTMGRSQIEEPPHCPLVGEFSGVLPDADGLCARSYADCNNPEVMFYTVFNCHNQTEVYEEREYRCFGQWQEDGLVYTYTERKDIPGNECFVGVTLDEDRNMVSEAGQNCERGHEPTKYGMTLVRKAKCNNSNHRGSLDRGHSGPEFSVIDNLSNLEEEEEKQLQEELQRTVSPRLSTVHSVINIDTSSASDVESDEVNNNVRRVNNRKHNHRHHRNKGDNYESDILTNEISGSASPSSATTNHNSSSAVAGNSNLLLLLLTLSSILTLRGFQFCWHWWREKHKFFFLYVHKIHSEKPFIKCF